MKGRVVARNLKTSMYNVSFINPTSHKRVQKWISVEDITSISSQEEKAKRKEQEQKRKKRLHRKKFHIVLTREDRLEFFRESTPIAFDPPKDGNCQFSALCFFLRRIGIERSPETLRKEIVRYLREHPNDLEGFPLELFASQGWAEYLAEMNKDGTYGDQITLQAASNIFNVQITVHSSLGVEATTMISPFTQVGVTNFNLGHFAEGQGEHYVCLEVEVDGAENCSSDKQENQELSNEDENDTEKAEDNNGKRENKTNCGANREEQRVKEGIYENPNDHQQRRSNKTSSFDHLPNEIIAMIFETAIRSSNPCDECILFQRLRNVCSRFRQCADTFTYLLPKIYYRDGSPGIISVRHLIKEFGPSSGLMLELRRLINSNRWHHAWLELYAIGLGWFQIKNIFWRK